MALALLFFVPPAYATAPKQPFMPPVGLYEALLPICTCESGQGTGKPQQYDVKTGDVLHGKVNHNDIGMCQINVQPENGHLVEADKLGVDVYTEQGNIIFANWLYDQQGATPWNSSKGCWGSKKLPQ